MKFYRFLPVLLLALLLSGCSSREVHTRETYAMNTLMQLTVYGSGGEQALTDGVVLLNEIEKTLSVTLEDSEISCLNREGSGTVSADTAQLLRRLLSISDETGGAFRPDLYTVTSLWGFTTGEYRVPSAEEIASAAAAISGGTVTVEDCTVTLSGVRLDLGAAAKGYASEQIAALWREQGITSGIMSLGGNVQTVGVKPDGSLWKIGIVNPENVNESLCVLSLGETAVVTSGGYQRYFEADGVRYSHIMDPATAMPVETDLKSVTVVAADGLLADCCSTACYVMGLEKATEFWRSRSDLELVLVSEDGTVYVTEGLVGSVSGVSYEVLAR